MYFSEYKGVYFIEGRPEDAALIVPAFSTEINGFFTQSHLKTLDDVKEKMLAFVSKHRGNCVLDFKYGQKSTFWKSLFGMDNVTWYASGAVGYITPNILQKYSQGGIPKQEA